MENNELKSRILKNVKEDIAISAIRKELNMEKVRKQKRIYGILSTCAVFMIVVAVFINRNGIDTDIDKPTDLYATLEQKEDSILDFFTVKVYAASLENNNSKEEALNTNVEIPLAKYSQTMSSVPGLPFKIETDEQKISEISIKTDNGEILTWNEKTGEVKVQGKTLLYSTNNEENKMFYWSPKDIIESTEYEDNIWRQKDITTVAQIKIETKVKDENINKIIYIGENDYNFYAIEKDEGSEKYISTSKEVEDKDIGVKEQTREISSNSTYPEYYAGKYVDKNGNNVVWLCNDNEENRNAVCKYLGTSQSKTIFKTAKYSYNYLTELQEKISKAMANKEIPFVTSSALRDTTNNIVVTVTNNNEDDWNKVKTLDTIGGAIEIQYNPNSQAHEDVAILE